MIGGSVEENLSAVQWRSKIQIKANAFIDFN